jgi:predicted extracellular nuclease
MWYNVENLFDCEDDTLKNDNEFLPSGKRAWTYSKYIEKTVRISKVIVAVGEWKSPALIGLCEVENAKCLTQLTKFSPLKKLNYRFVHHDSPDPRGIDVALLYDPTQFKLISEGVVPVVLASGHRTRDVLYIKGQTENKDTIHVFVCHWPSRLGGEKESEPKRISAAKIIRTKIDSIFVVNNKANIIVMGDFNDYPISKSLTSGLRALPFSNNCNNKNLYNLMYQMHISEKGTNKYRGEWGVLDQIIVSGNLLDSKSQMFTSLEKASIFSPDFLLEDDIKYLGKQPFRTYNGFKYQGGYSDHLPVYVDFVLKMR